MSAIIRWIDDQIYGVTFLRWMLPVCFRLARGRFFIFRDVPDWVVFDVEEIGALNEEKYARVSQLVEAAIDEAKLRRRRLNANA